MRKTTIPATGAALLLVGGLSIIGASAATAAPAPGDLTATCVPSDESSTTEETGWLTADQAPSADEGWTTVETRTVVDIEEETLTEFLVAFYDQTDWVLTSPGDEYVQIAERTVIDQEFVPGEYEITGWVTTSPGEGWIQKHERWVVDHEATPASGEPTITVDNPDYVPAVPAVEEQGHWVDGEMTDPGSPAVDPIPAVTQTEWKYSKHGGYGFIWVDNDDEKYVWVDGHKYERTQHTRQVEVTPAVPGKDAVPPTYGPDVWVVDVEGQDAIPAQGEPTIEVANPDYVPATDEIGHWEYKFAWYVAPIQEESHQEFKYAAYVPPTWVVEVPDGYTVKDERVTVITPEESHEEARYSLTVTVPAVDCPPVVTPPVDEPPVVTPPVVTPPAAVAPPVALTPPAAVTTPQVVTQDVPVQADEVETLAYTGAGDSATQAASLAALMALAGGALVAIRRRLSRG